MVNGTKGDPVAHVLPHDLQRMCDLAVGNIQYNLPLYPKPVDGAVALHVGPVGDPADVPTNGVLRTKTHGKNDMVLIDGPAHELRLLRAARITLNEEKKA